MGHLTQNLGRTPTYAECLAGAGDVVDLPTGLVDLRLHDLRRTVGSWLSQSGVDLNVVKDAMHYANLATTLIYAQLGADPAREAVLAYGTYCTQALYRNCWPRPERMKISARNVRATGLI